VANSCFLFVLVKLLVIRVSKFTLSISYRKDAAINIICLYLTFMLPRTEVWGFYVFCQSLQMSAEESVPWNCPCLPVSKFLPAHHFITPSHYTSSTVASMLLNSWRINQQLFLRNEGSSISIMTMVWTLVSLLWVYTGTETKGRYSNMLDSWTYHTSQRW
jgi:hypothetical protein